MHNATFQNFIRMSFIINNKIQEYGTVIQALLIIWVFICFLKNGYYLIQRYILTYVITQRLTAFFDNSNSFFFFLLKTVFSWNFMKIFIRILKLNAHLSICMSVFRTQNLVKTTHPFQNFDCIVNVCITVLYFYK